MKCCHLTTNKYIGFTSPVVWWSRCGTVVTLIIVASNCTAQNFTQETKLEGGHLMRYNGARSIRSQVPCFQYFYPYLHLYRQVWKQFVWKLLMHENQNEPFNLTWRGLGYTIKHSENVQSQTFWIITYLTIKWRLYGVAPFKSNVVSVVYWDNKPSIPIGKGNTK